MKYLVAALALLASACTNLHPVKTVGPETYQLTHIMPQKLPISGAQNALTNLAEKKCAEESGPYSKVSEDVTETGTRRTVVLTFTCKPVLKSTAFAPSVIAPTAQVSYSTPMNLQPSQLLVK